MDRESFIIKKNILTPYLHTETRGHKRPQDHKTPPLLARDEEYKGT